MAYIEPRAACVHLYIRMEVLGYQVIQVTCIWIFFGSNSNLALLGKINHWICSRSITSIGINLCIIYNYYPHVYIIYIFIIVAHWLSLKMHVLMYTNKITDECWGQIKVCMTISILDGAPHPATYLFFFLVPYTDMTSAHRNSGPQFYPFKGEVDLSRSRR